MIGAPRTIEGGSAAEWEHAVGTTCVNRAFRVLVLVFAGCGSAVPNNAMATTPTGSIYVCVTEAGGVRSEAPIEFPPKVGALCAKHPEMGPCQYERNVCRNSGGRVYAAGGVEVTMQMESEYDRKVMRVRIK